MFNNIIGLIMMNNWFGKMKDYVNSKTKPTQEEDSVEIKELNRSQSFTENLYKYNIFKGRSTNGV